MPLIRESDRARIREWFDRELDHGLKIVHFTRSNLLGQPVLIVPTQERHYHRETHDLLREVAELSDKITLEVHDIVVEAEAAKEYQVDNTPATVLVGAERYGIHFFGFPSGQPFSALIQTIIDVSRGTGRFSAETTEKLKGIPQDVHLQVFITPI